MKKSLSFLLLVLVLALGVASFTIAQEMHSKFQRSIFGGKDDREIDFPSLTEVVAVLRHSP